MDEADLVEEVREKYAAVARSGLSGEDGGVRAVARAFGYTSEELSAVPAGANLGLSCGNPTALAHLEPGEVVVDLGSGGGLDVLLASRKVGSTGRAIGIDMTAEMVERARRNAVQFGGGQAPANVEFHLAPIERLPLADRSVDCLISNCVINLAPDKRAVFKEMFRVLKPGGRLAITDIALKRPLPEEVSRDIQAYVGCLAGAALIADYEQMLLDAGFSAVQVVDARKDLGAYRQAGEGCCSGDSCCGPPAPPAAYEINDFAASVQVFAIKDGTERSAPDDGKEPR